MTLFSSLFNMFAGSSEDDGEKVLDVQTKKYKRIPVFHRYDCLVMYGPNNGVYELLLLQPVSMSASWAFSLFRLRNKEEALERFSALQTSLLPLLKLSESQILRKNILTQICDLLKFIPSYKTVHIIVALNFTWALESDLFIKFIDEQDWQYGRTPLHVAIEKENSWLIGQIIQKCNTEAVDFHKNTNYHYAAVTTPNILKMISENTVNGLNTLNAAGKSPLHLACKEDKPECVRELLSLGADANTASTVDSILPIHEAVTADNYVCVKEILKMYPNQLSSTDMKYGGTPLHWSNSKNMINELCKLGCEVDARNFQKASALHVMVEKGRLDCVICLLANDANVNMQDVNGNTPLHLTSDQLILKSLLVFKADFEMLNYKGLSVRHIVASSKYPNKHQLIFLLHRLGAKRCSQISSTCNDGCSPEGCFDGIPPEVKVTKRLRSSFDCLLDEQISSDYFDAEFFSNRKRGRVLCLDGGGIKGLVLIQMLKMFEQTAEAPVISLFDWVAGTSTGGIIALAICLGYSLDKCQSMYFRMKDEVFVGIRPYNAKPLEKALQRELGSHTTMADINSSIKAIVTAVTVDRFPADLHFFRNYISSGEIFKAMGGNVDTGSYECESDPSEQLVWKAARASCAAPTYFEPFENFADGGIISNNPTLDVLTEITEYNTMLRMVGNQSKVFAANIVVSLGVGKPPLIPKEGNRAQSSENSFFRSIKAVMGLSDTLKLIVDQATMSDNRTVDRARAWCGQLGIKYLRLSPQLTQEVELDETRDDIIINMLFEALVYSYESRDKIASYVHLLKEAGSSPLMSPS